MLDAGFEKQCGGQRYITPRYRLASFMVVTLGAAGLLINLSGCGAKTHGSSPSQKIKIRQVVVIFQENRSTKRIDPPTTCSGAIKSGSVREPALQPWGSTGNVLVMSSGLSPTLAEVFYAFQNSFEAFLERAALDFLCRE
jgi:hypothetical protein